MKSRLQNFWYYYKVHTIIILAILAAGLWFYLQDKLLTSPDYDVAIVSPRGFSDEQLGKIRRLLELMGKDQDRDGFVRVMVNLYSFAIGEEGQDQTEIAKLDADLVGHRSGIFFTEDPEQFEASTNGIGKAADAIPVSEIPLLSDCGIDDLYILIREDAEDKYTELRSALTE